MKRFDETADVHSVRSDGREMWLVISAANGVRTIPLPRKPEVVIGRMHTCDIVIEDESVSRTHAVIRQGESMHIEDLGSRNKTRVLGKALGKGERTPVTVGSVVEIGYATILVQLGRPEQSRVAPPSQPTRPGGPVPSPGPIVLDPTMQRLYALLDVIAPSPLNVLILGETGTGKEVFAEAIHTGSARADKPFLRVNCAGLSGSLLESELFGHEKGAFTGALQAKSGLFEAADGGTVFLDEVGELPIETQAKLLRVIERGEVIRLGSVQSKRVDVRYVAATNRDVLMFIEQGRFRSDLYFRLNGFSVTLPPLRKRRAEIAPLAKLFGARAARRAVELTPAAEHALAGYAWPGNVRELKNVIERAVVLSGSSPTIDVPHLQLPEATFNPEASSPGTIDPAAGTWPPPAPTYPMYPHASSQPLGLTPAFGVPVAGHPAQAAPIPPGAMPPHTSPPPTGPQTDAASLKAQRESWEKQQVLAALERTSGNQKEAAKLLGVSRRTLINKIEAYGIARPRKR